MQALRFLATFSFFLLVSCGSTVVDPGAGGSGGTATTTTSSSSTSSTTDTSSNTGSSFCDAHNQCPGELCIFSTGLCAPSCGGDLCDSCGAGAICETCATSSCPECDDCVSACVPTEPGHCDDDDPCESGSVCIFSSRSCFPECDSAGNCPDFSYCDDCATSSCCGCKNCISGCLGGE